jgi:FkbM family methyltransferase
MTDINMKVFAHTSIIGNTGYNNHSRNFFKALDKIVPVQVRNFTIGSNWKGYNNDEPHNNEVYVDEQLKKMLVQQSLFTADKKYENFPLYVKYPNEGEPTVNIILNDTNHNYFYEDYDGPKIAYNVWETTRQPNDFFERLKKFDQVWVPTEWQKECTIAQGIKREKVKVVPEAVDIEKFKPSDKTWGDGKFRFLVFGRWEYRKSTREIIETFIRTFNGIENVELVLSVDNSFAIDCLSSTEERLNYYGLNNDKIKVIHFPSEEEYIEYLQKGHVFVSCARSEGWNLPLIEAMACGTPSIYSNWGGQLEFASNKGIPVDIVGLKDAMVGEGYSEIKRLPGKYCEPNFDDLGVKMMEVYNNYEFYKQRAIIDSDIIRSTFTWDNVASVALDYINELSTKVEPNTQKEFEDDFAFVTCGNENYMGVIEKMVQSLLVFSKRKIIVYGINCDVPFDYPNVIKRRLNITHYSEHDKWYWKQHANIESLKEDYENYIWIDGDVVVNYNIDGFSKHFGDLEHYPISDIHLHEEFIGPTGKDDGKLQLFNEILINDKHKNVKRFLPFSHVCLFIYNKQCEWFFKEILDEYYNCDLTTYKSLYLWNDEGIHNLLLWKYGLRKHLPLSNFDTSGYDYDSNSSEPRMENFYTFWIKDGVCNFGKIYGYEYVPKDKSTIRYFHGNKNYELSDKMIEYIKTRRDNNFSDTEMFFCSKYNVKNLGSIKNVEGSTLSIADRYGWDYAIYHEIFNLRDYTPLYIPEMKINHGDVVVDLGGNIGVFNRYAYHKGASKIISFEPDKRYFELLNLNKSPNSILFNAAMSNKIGKIKLTESEHLGGSNILMGQNELSNQYEVETYCLNYLFETGIVEKIDFLKVDIEGAEKYVFQGISDENLLKINKISMEYHHAALGRNEKERHDFIVRLNKLGFNSYILFMGNDEALQMIYFWK